MKIIFLIVFFLFSIQFSVAEPITPITENFPPFDFKKDNKIVGISTDILKEMFRRSNIEHKKIKLVPWARGCIITKLKKNTLLFSTVRTKEREKLFKWVGPIFITKDTLISYKKPIKITKKNIKKLRIITIINDSAETKFFKKFGKDLKIDRMSGENAICGALLKLKYGRADILAYDMNVVKWIAKTNNLGIDNFKIVYTLQKAPLYFALNKDTPDEIIKKLQKALDEIKKDGTYQKIIKKYLK